VKPYSLEYDGLSHSQVLNLIDDADVDLKALRSKKYFITTGLPEQPTFEVIYDWRTSKIDYLEFLPGCQTSMLNTRPNLEFLFVELILRNAKYYELIYNIFTNAST